MKKARAHFPTVPVIPYEGPGTDNPLAFRHYNPDEVIDGRTMADHLRFSIAYWHAFRGVGADPFGPGTIVRPWEAGRDPVGVAKVRLEAAFEFFQKIRAPFYCFHDRDIAPEGKTLAESNRILDQVAGHAHAKTIGFKGKFLIEPKPKEPTKHQYDFDVASGIAFLRTFGLEKHFKFNIETNHATLAGHTFQHEIEVAAAAGMLGSIDANAGDLLLGWDTDQFNTDVRELTLAMISILRAGGLGSGGFNFDAKLRRPSIDPEDLFHAHIGGMDAYALAFKLARRILAEGKFETFVRERYASFDTGFGRDIERGKADFRSLEKLVLTKLGEPQPRSGRQEYLENLLLAYLHR